MLEREPGQRLLLVEGRPWKDALIAYLEPRSPYRPWFGLGGTKTGDLIVTVLDTDPRTVLCVERLGSDRGFDVVERVELDLPTVNVVEQQAGTTLPTTPRFVDDGAADRLLRAVAGHERQLWSTRDYGRRFEANTAEAARVLCASGGMCSGCEQPLALRGPTARDRVHIRVVPGAAFGEPAADRSSVLCEKCRQAMDDGGFPTFVDYRYSLQPQCPKCSAYRTQTVQYGMPPYAEWLDNRPWETEGGCCISEGSPRWTCGSCGYGWTFNVDPRFVDDDRNARHGDYVAAHLFNFDGRRAHMFPPDVDHPDELQFGRLVIDGVASAWGGYTRYAIVRDDGAVREIEPDTIAAVCRPTPV